MAKKSKPKDMAARAELKAARRAARKERSPQITPWKKILLAFAGVSVVVGLVLTFIGGGNSGEKSAPAGAGGTSSSIEGNSLVGGGGIELPTGGTGGTGGAGTEGEEEVGPGGWSPFFLKGGFSFFVAFCVGFAARVWLKVTMLLLGTFFLGVFVLSYFGAMEVNWTTLEGWWNALSDHVSAQASNFKTFLTGSLPQAGLASLGLVTGFKRR